MFDAYVALQARIQPQAPAIVTPRGPIAFARFDADIDRAACALRALDPGIDGSVAVETADPYLYWVVLLALSRLGIASAPADDHESCLRISDRPGADATIALTEALVAEIAGGQPRKVAPCRRLPDGLGRVFRSSGTTGEPKRVGLNWRQLDLGVRSAFVTYGAPRGPWRANTGPDTILGFIIATGCWAGGNPLLLGIGGALTGEILRTTKPALVVLVPDQLAALLDTLAPDHPRLPLRIAAGGGAVPPALARRARERLTDDVRSVYGTSESGALALAPLALLERVPGAAGYVLPNVELQIVDEAGMPVAPGTVGHVRARGERVIGGYLDDPERSARTFRDGWLWPGDLGRIDADGLLVIEGRADDIMNLGGQKILPAWVEQAALSVPGIVDAGAFSVADKDGIERCWLALVVDGPLDEPALAEALRRQLAWMPRVHWLTLDQMPRNAMGKIERLKLRALAQAIPLRFSS